MEQLYIIAWQEREREPDWLHLVANNLTEARAQRYIKKYLLEMDDNPDAEFEYFWYEPVQQADGVGNKNKYIVRLDKLK